MKDEFGGKIMTEFVGLIAKLYSYKMLDEKETKKWKGIKKSVVDKTIPFEVYKKCLLGGKKKWEKWTSFKAASVKSFLRK